MVNFINADFVYKDLFAKLGEKGAYENKDI